MKLKGHQRTKISKAANLDYIPLTMGAVRRVGFAASVLDKNRSTGEDEQEQS